MSARVFEVHYELNADCGCVWARHSTLKAAREELRKRRSSKLRPMPDIFVVKVTTERVK